MNIEQNEEKSQTQGKFAAVRTETKDVNRYVMMCPTLTQESYNAGHAPCQPILSLGNRYQNPGDHRSKSIRCGIV